MCLFAAVESEPELLSMRRCVAALPRGRLATIWSPYLYVGYNTLANGAFLRLPAVHRLVCFTNPTRSTGKGETNRLTSRAAATEATRTSRRRCPRRPR